MPFPTAPRTADTRPAASYGDSPAVAGGFSVAEARIRLEIAERGFEHTKFHFDRGVTKSLELRKAEDELKLARLALDRARSEFEARRNLLELDVAQAELELREVLEELRALERIHRDSPGTVPAVEMKQAEFKADQRKIALERAKALLEVHQQQAEPSGKEDSEPRSSQP
jgi:hypothetical protein